MLTDLLMLPESDMDFPDLDRLMERDLERDSLPDGMRLTDLETDRLRERLPERYWLLLFDRESDISSSSPAVA